MARLKTGINYIIDFRNAIPAQYRSYIDPSFKAVFDKLTTAKGAELGNYIEGVFK